MSKSLWMLAAAASLCLAVPADDDILALPAGPGKEIVGKACIDCHDTATFRKKRLGQDEWTEIVGDMVDRGAKANEQEQAAVVAYLIKNFGKDSKVNMNTAPLTELRAVLDLTTAESQMILAWRKDHPAFQEWGDLLKIPGLDGKKVEARKDKMAF